MSDTKPQDGGPAFPIAKGIETRDGTIRKTEMNEGMSLRDYFAAAALAGIMSTLGANRLDIFEAAQGAYNAADAMLKTRQRS